MKVILLASALAFILSVVGCIDNPTLPNLIRLPFEGSGQSANLVREMVILEVEGRGSGYSVGSRWIEMYEDKLNAISIGAGEGIDGEVGTDSRPCLRYKVVRTDISMFCDVVFASAAETGMWKVFISEVFDGGELRQISSWSF